MKNKRNKTKLKFIKGIGQYYNQNFMTKISFMKASFCILLKLKEDEICIYKDILEDVLPDESIYAVDEDLSINLDNVIQVSFKEDWCYFKTISKIQHRDKFLNFNIKATGKNEYIKHKLKGEPMWVEIGHNFYNTDNINNIVVNENDMIINFKNTESAKKDVESVRASYIITDMHDIGQFTRSDEWVQVGNRFVNLKNVYNIKFDENKEIVYFNFTSNVSKIINDKKIISTEYVKHDCTKEQYEQLILTIKR
jgi:hypothetical protein